MPDEQPRRLYASEVFCFLGFLGLLASVVCAACRPNAVFPGFLAYAGFVVFYTSLACIPKKGGSNE